MIQTINISLIPSDNKPVINVSQFDNISRVLRFNVFDDVDMEVPHVFDDGDTVLLNIRKNDNNIVVITGVIVSDIDPETQEVTGQYLTFELTEQACACVGSNYGEVSITSGDDEVIGSCNFKLIVERSPLAGGVSSQTAIDNLTTQIEEITEEVIGDNYYDKEDIDGKFDELNIPTKTSQLTNDSGFITSADIPTIPTKTSQLTNDSGFITASALPTKTSQLTNDSGFITASDIPTIPTKTSQLTNDSGFTTIDDAATANDKTWSSDKISDELYDLLPVGTASGSVASFNTALAKPLVSCVVDVNATHIIHCGSNVWDEKLELGVWNDSQERWDISTLQLKSKNYIPITPNTTFRLKNPTGTISRYVYYDKDKNYLSFTNANSNQAFTTPANAYYMMFGLSVAYGTTYNNDISINYPSTDTTYHAYNGEEVNISDKDNIVTYNGINNIYTDAGDTIIQYKDTIQNYIDTRVNTVSNRSLSMMRTLETLERATTLERGDNNDDNAR